jgi:hypothetical protein
VDRFVLDAAHALFLLAGSFAHHPHTHTAHFNPLLTVLLVWQALYIFKTELMDKKKLDSDANIMTSLRWFIREDKPHPIYKALLVNGIRIKPLVLLVCTRTDTPSYPLSFWFPVEALLVPALTTPPPPKQSFSSRTRY